MVCDVILFGFVLLCWVDWCKVLMVVMVCSMLLVSFGLVLGLNVMVVGMLIVFGSGGFFVVFLIVVVCVFWVCFVGCWDLDKGVLCLGCVGLVVNVLVVVWLFFEVFNVVWLWVSFVLFDVFWF